MAVVANGKCFVRVYKFVDASVYIDNINTWKTSPAVDMGAV